MHAWITRIREKLIVFILGLILIMVILEIVLRIIGYGEVRSPAFNEKVCHKGPNDYVILCIGDSFTAGCESPPDKSYPRQLEELLNAEVKRENFRVINKGMGAYNTAQILSELNRNIQTTNPDLVILLAGGSNLWNAWGYRQYLEKRSPLFGLQDIIYRIRLFKLVKLIAIDMQNKLKKQKVDSLNTFSRQDFLMNESPLDAVYYQDKARSYEEKGMYKEAVEYYLKETEIDPDNHALYGCIGSIYCNKLNNSEEGIKMLQRAIEINPNCSFWFYMLLDKEYRGNEEKLAQFLSRFSDSSKTAKGFMNMALERKTFQDEARKWITLDIKAMLDICSQNDVKLMLQDYPMASKNSPGLNDNINLIIAEVAKKYSLPLVENDSVFKKLFQNGAKPEDYFMPGEHPNVIGYGIMARNIYNKMVEEKLILSDR